MTDFPWPDGKLGALSWTFDDARPSQLDHAVPLLDEMGVRATFYVEPGPLRERADEWREVAQTHEIGNHTDTHPCSGNFDWSQHNPVEDYDLPRYERELDRADEIIQGVCGLKTATFAYPCGLTTVGRGLEARSLVPLVAERFLAGRAAFRETANDPLRCDLANLDAISADDQNAADLTPFLQPGRWLILFAHDVLPQGGRQTMTLNTLQEVTLAAKDHWVAPVADVAEWVRSRR